MDIKDQKRLFILSSLSHLQIHEQMDLFKFVSISFCQMFSLWEGGA